MDKDSPNVLDTSCGSTMETVMKNIYTSCDPQNQNMVPTSEIIDFIRPYLLEDLSALETLRNMLDPENKNVTVAGEQFFNVMNEWTQKIASHTEEDVDGEFNRTPSQLNVPDEKLLPYTQSTPRASFGQKLLNCEGLLNLSNVSSYNLSPTKQAKDISIGGSEKTMLEEEVKQLQHQLNRVLSDVKMLKTQLASSEDQNEALQEELEKCRTRSQSGQQVNENVEENKTCGDDLREEIEQGQKRIEELNKKLTFMEQDNFQLNLYIQKLEQENLELEERFAKTKQNLENEISGLRTVLEMKDHEISTISKINDELRFKLCEKITELEQVLAENEVLDYKQQDLEKLLSSKRYSLSSQYNSCLDEMGSFLARGNTIPIYSSPIKNKSFSNSPLTKKVILTTPKIVYQVLNSSTPKNSNCVGMRKSLSLNTMSTRSLPNIFCFERSNIVQDQADKGDEIQSTILNAGPYESLQTELFQVDPQFDQKDKNGTDCDHDEQILFIKNESEYLQTKIERLEEEKKVLNIEFNIVNDKAKELERKLSNLMLEKEEIKTDKIKMERELEVLKSEFNKLKSTLDERCQFEDKFDFEPLYKKLEIQYAIKVAQIDELQSKIKVLENNMKIPTTLKSLGLETKEMLKDGTDDNLNQSDCENLKKEIIKLEKDLQEKNIRNKQLKDMLRKDSDTKNEIWLSNDILRKELDGIKKENLDIVKKLGEYEINKQELQSKYDDINEKYNFEVEKNGELLIQISTKNQHLLDIQIKCDQLELKLNEELSKNSKLKTQVSLLKKEADNIKENHKSSKEEIMKKLTEYDNSLQTLYHKIKDLESENSALKLVNQGKFVSDSKYFECEDSGVRSELEMEEEKSRKYTDTDVSSESSITFAYDKPRLSKNISFEKKKLTIDKLRDELQQEKYKNEALKERLYSKLKELDEGSISEQEKLKTVINELNNKLNQQKDFYQHICKASNEKIDRLSQELSTLNEKHSNTLLTLTEKEQLLKRTYEAYEYNKGVLEKLYKEVNDFKIMQNKLSTDLAAKEIYLRNISEENQNLKSLAILSDKKLVELSSKLLKQESDLNNYQLDLHRKSEAISKLSSMLTDRDNKIQVLSSAAICYDNKMSNMLMELTEKEEAYAKLDHEFKLLNKKLLQSTHIEINSMTPEKFFKTHCDSEKSETINGHESEETTLDKLSNFTNIISECCNELNRAFMRFIERWRKKIEANPNFKNLPCIKLCQSLNVEDVLSVIVDNVGTVIMLLDIMFSISPETMDKDTETLLDAVTDQSNTNSVDSRNIKKFTLRPATLLLSRPASPDSPGIKETSLQSEEKMCDMESLSPDSQNFRLNSEGENERVRRYNLPLLSFDLPVQDAFPHVSDTILEKLGLHEGSPKLKLTKEETEEVFTSFAIQVGLDSKNVKDRLQEQKNLCTQKYKKYQYLIKDISMRLRDHNCIGSMDSINPVFVMLEDVRLMMQDLMQSAGQVGILTCELRMTKCWNLVTNYMAILKQDLENTKSSPKPCVPVRTKFLPSADLKFISKRSKTEENKNTKEQNSRYRNCLSSLTHCIMWVLFASLLLLIAVVCVHWQCKMTTEYKICPLDDVIRIISQRVGSPPY